MSSLFVLFLYFFVFWGQEYVLTQEYMSFVYVTIYIKRSLCFKTSSRNVFISDRHNERYWIQEWISLNWLMHFSYLYHTLLWAGQYESVQLFAPWIDFFAVFLAFDFCRFYVVIRFFHPCHNGQWPPTSKGTQHINLQSVFGSVCKMYGL